MTTCPLPRTQVRHSSLDRRAKPFRPSALHRKHIRIADMPKETHGPVHILAHSLASAYPKRPKRDRFESFHYPSIQPETLDASYLSSLSPSYPPELRNHLDAYPSLPDILWHRRKNRRSALRVPLKSQTLEYTDGPDTWSDPLPNKKSLKTQAKVAHRRHQRAHRARAKASRSARIQAFRSKRKQSEHPALARTTLPLAGRQSQSLHRLSNGDQLASAHPSSPSERPTPDYERRKADHAPPPRYSARQGPPSKPSRAAPSKKGLTSDLLSALEHSTA